MVAPGLLGLAVAGGGPEAVGRVVGGRVAVVTGASRGIGREMALRLAAAGATVVGVARTQTALEQVARQAAGFGGAVHPLAGDLRDAGWAQAAAARVIEQRGTPALLVSNAGHSIHRPLAESWGRLHDIQRLDGINHVGAVAFAMPLLAAMAQAGRGHLLAVSTTMVQAPVPNWAAYTASKAAFDYWLRCVGPELRQAGVAVTTVSLPRVATAMSAPTRGAVRLPELSVAQAANVLTRAVVRRPRHVIPWWARFAGGLAGAVPDAVERLWETALRFGIRP